MQKIENFITRALANYKTKHSDYYKAYPQLLDKSAKIHVLYLAPFNNAVGLYRTLLPSIQLNKSTTHAAIVTDLLPYPSPTKEIKWELSDEMIQWADYIVFPTITEDLSNQIAEFKKINTKPHLKFVFDIDDNYHYPKLGENLKLAQQSRKDILSNMLACNIITCSTDVLGNFYINSLQQQKAKTLPDFFVAPNFMSYSTFENVSIIEPRPQKLRIGMILNPTQWDDIYPLRKTFIQIMEKHKDKAELVLFGWNGKIGFKEALKGIKFTHIPPVPISQYFNTLANLQFDMALMPLKDTPANNCKTYHKLLQYSMLNIPAIVSSVLPYTQILSPGKSIHDENYLPALQCTHPEDWIKNIDFLIQNEVVRKNVAQTSQKYVNQHFILEDRPNFYCELFK